ncbi:MAG: hypothetical protein OSJ72_11210 [Lachnospiraceae bacterium]|nr:hypothetical protein [Lachnospiraceae bacterium]
MSVQTIHGNGNKVKGDTKKTKISISIGSVVIIAVIAYVWLFLPNSLERSMIGTWQLDEQPQTYFIFGRNGEFTVLDNTASLDGTYTFLSDTTVQIHIKYFIVNYRFSGDIVIEDNHMTISNVSDSLGTYGADGETITLTKTK